jgi:hypothetical protein
MGFYGRAGTHLPQVTMSNAKHRLEWCKAIGLWCSGNASKGVTNHAYHLAVQQTNLGLVDATRMLLAIFMVQPMSLSSCEGKS